MKELNCLTEREIMVLHALWLNKNTTDFFDPKHSSKKKLQMIKKFMKFPDFADIIESKTLTAYKIEEFIESIMNTDFKLSLKYYGDVLLKFFDAVYAKIDAASPPISVKGFKDKVLQRYTVANVNDVWTILDNRRHRA